MLAMLSIPLHTLIDLSIFLFNGASSGPVTASTGRYLFCQDGLGAGSVEGGEPRTDV